MAENNPTLFTDATYDEIVNNLYKDEEHKGPVTVFGKTFQNDNERREYYRQELKKMLPELRAMEGFPNGSDEDIINLSDPPYYTACPNPWFNNFIEEWEKEQDELSKSGERNESMRTAEPFVNDISEGKYNDIYFKHPYHTKVPIAAIEQYLKHYTLPGDIIFDGFAGTGMTGVAAQLTDRKLKSITLDLAPIASYINYYYNYPASPKYSRPFLLNQFNKLQEQYSWLYETKHTNGDKGTISSVIWSEVFVCPTCGEELVFWDNGVDVENGKERLMPAGLIDRLTLNHERLEGMADGLRQIAKLDDPIGEVLSMKKRPNGLIIGKRRVPLGVIGIIFEARPNVTSDACM